MRPAHSNRRSLVAAGLLGGYLALTPACDRDMETTAPSVNAAVQPKASNGPNVERSPVLSVAQNGELFWNDAAAQEGSVGPTSARKGPLTRRLDLGSVASLPNRHRSGAGSLLPAIELVSTLASADSFMLDLGLVEISALTNRSVGGVTLDLRALDAMKCAGLQLYDRRAAAFVTIPASGEVSLEVARVRDYIVHCGASVNVHIRGPVGDDSLWVFGEPAMDVRWLAAEVAVMRDRIENLFGTRIERGWTTEFITPAGANDGQFEVSVTATGIRIIADASIQLGAQERLSIGRVIARAWISRSKSASTVPREHPLEQAVLDGIADAISLKINAQIGLITMDDVADHIARLERVAALTVRPLPAPGAGTFPAQEPGARLARVSLALTALAVAQRERGDWLFESLGSAPQANADVLTLLTQAAVDSGDLRSTQLARALLAGERPPDSSPVLGAKCFRRTSMLRSLAPEQALNFSWSIEQGLTLAQLPEGPSVKVLTSQAAADAGSPVSAPITDTQANSVLGGKVVEYLPAGSVMVDGALVAETRLVVRPSSRGGPPSTQTQEIELLVAAPTQKTKAWTYAARADVPPGFCDW